MNKLYLVTGAAGHLGHNLIRMLADKGEKVRALILPGEYHRLPESAEICEGNVCDRESLVDFFHTGEYDRAILIHAAAVVTILSRVDKNMWDVNVDGTANILSMCAEHSIDRIVYVSSVHAIPECPVPELIAETRQFSPDSVEGQYAKSKAAAAGLALKMAEEKHLNMSVVHPSGIIGPGDFNRRNHLMRMIEAAAKGRLPVGTQGGYDLVDVRDVAQGILDCVEKGKTGECYILSGHPCTIKELLCGIADETGRKPPKFYLPLSAARRFAPIAEAITLFTGKLPVYTPYAIDTLGTNYRFTYQKAGECWGYAPRPLRQTLHDTVCALRDNKLI